MARSRAGRAGQQCCANWRLNLRQQAVTHPIHVLQFGKGVRGEEGKWSGTLSQKCLSKTRCWELTQIVYLFGRLESACWFGSLAEFVQDESVNGWIFFLRFARFYPRNSWRVAPFDMLHFLSLRTQKCLKTWTLCKQKKNEYLLSIFKLLKIQSKSRSPGRAYFVHELAPKNERILFSTAERHFV